MTGPEHYREAERLLNGANRTVTVEPGTFDHDRSEREVPAVNAAYRMAMLAGAQVHATLALAAATAAGQASAYDGDEYGARSRGWAGVA